MLIRRVNEYQIVFYCYQNRGRVIVSEYWEKIYQVTDALLMGRRDGTFVRIMARVPGNGSIEKNRQELDGFSGLVMTNLEQYPLGAKI
ncbi:exosortase-associated EpsI family protein [Desulfopila sp. IMCC35008]|uniref:exosortase-associated EpsI family protein n=1 Tax=Desulfopila sp. IMCC35008 TaxID=2653858 RepID=UPI00210280E5|nr:exosortase-associated EpsI family protein [Desulfopila sp. IMCC35008]